MAKRRINLEFPGSDGLTIAGILEIPESTPHAFVLFAHCFTCGKDVVAASRISRYLVERGFAVLRFDFTGVGKSEGEFADSNFTSNVKDLLFAANFLREDYLAPALLIGHSLGGAAVLSAASEIPEARGVVTIGAPADPNHVMKQFVCEVPVIEEHGEAVVSLANRDFTIKKQFLDDLNAQNQMDKISHLHKALLVFHSPVDETVNISEAEKIYVTAKHPKSFVSLDTADHLLTSAQDAEYVAATIAAWASRFVDSTFGVKQFESNVSRGHVKINEKNREFLRTVVSDHHAWYADEPTSVGGSDLGPDPYEHLLAALGACTSMTIRMYANRKEIPLDDVTIEVSHDREHVTDCEGCDESPKKIEVLERTIVLKGELSEAQRKRLLEVADRCPVHRTLESELHIRTELVD